MCVCRPIGAIAAAASSAVFLLAAAGLPTHAIAQPEHVHLRFLAPKGCPDSAAFIQAVRQRTARFLLASSLEEARTFLATIMRAGSGFSGRLQAQTPGGKSSERAVSGKTCDEVMSVLAFMTALAIDPSASQPSASQSSAARQNPRALRPANPAASVPGTKSADPSDRVSSATEASPPEQAAMPAAAPASVPALPRADESLEPNRPRSRALPPPDATPSVTAGPEPSAPSGATASARWKWSAGAHGGVSLGISPTTGFGGLLFVETAAPGSAVLGPVLRFGLFLNRSDEALASGAEADFQWAAALLEGCPARLSLFDHGLTLHACLAFHLGGLRAQGRSLERTQETTDLWADLGPVARARMAIWGRLFLEAQAMLALPLRRISYDVYYTGPSGSPTTVHTVPWLGALVGIGLAYQFQ